MGDPRLLFLDEPTTGFDPSARRRAWELVASLRELGTTILLTTHYMEEAERLADRVAVIVAGRLVAIDAPPTSWRASRAPSSRSGSRRGRDPTGCRRSQAPWADDGVVTVESARPTADLLALTSWAEQHGVELADLTLTRPTLEDVYLRLTGDGGGRAWAGRDRRRPH